jgi:hypothetical protein
MADRQYTENPVLQEVALKVAALHECESESGLPLP